MNNSACNKLSKHFLRNLKFKSLVRYIFLSMMLFMSALIFSTQISSLMFALKGEAQTTSARIMDSLSEKLLPSLVTGDYELAQEVIDTSINDVNIDEVRLIINDKLSGDTIVITPKKLSNKSAFSQWLSGYAPAFLSGLALPAFNADIKPTVYQSGDFAGFNVNGIGKLELILDFSDVLFRQGVILLVAVVFLVFCFFFMLSLCNNIDKNVTYPLDDLLAATRKLISTNFQSVPRITESTQPEIAELINHFQKLSTVIVERTSELHELLVNRERVIQERTSDLWFALAEAKQLAQTKSNFINIMSHELNQPLFNARMAVMNMSRNPKLFGNQTVDHYCAIINQHLDNARGQIEHVLEFTGKGKKSYIPKSEIFDFYELVESLMVSHACAAAAKGLYIDLIVAPHFPNNIVSCPGGWRQILNNFIGNAVKFTEKGGVVIKISAKDFISASEFTLQVEVVDTGIGIADEDIEKIFEYYTQAGDATRRRQGGYGIGLGIVDNYVKALGGNRGVISSPAGSTFTVEIPVERSTKTLGQVQSTCIAMINQMRLFFILFDERESWRVALQSRIHNVSAHCLATDSLIEAMSIITRQGNSHTVVCVGRTGSNSLLVQHLDKLRAANPRLLIGMDFSIDHESSVDEYDLDIDLRLSGHIDMRDFVREIHDKMVSHQADEMPQRLIESSQSLHGKRILLVDDNQSNLDYTREFLMSYGAQVDTAHGPQQGLHMADAESYDAIFLDVMMPVINGIEVGAKIRNGEVNANSCLFAFTAGRLDDEMLAELDALGMHLLLKMDAREKLVKSIIDALHQAQLPFS